MTDSKSEMMRLKKALNDAEEANKVDDIKSILHQLKTGFVATEALLKETKIGVAGGRLRSNGNKDVVLLARELVKKWKDDVGSGRTSKPDKDVSKSPSASLKPSPSPALPTNSANTTDNALASTSRASPTPTTAKTEANTSAQSPPPSLEPGRERTTETDKVNTSVTEDKQRNKCIELVYNALASGSLASSKTILQRAKEVEKGTWSNRKDDAGYRTKMRNLVLTLRAKNNPDLRAAVISGEVDATKMWSMSPQELANAEQKAEIAKMHEQALFDAKGAAPTKSETDMFECGKCKQRRTTYYQMQTRSADEPMTTFVRCLACGHNWRFS